QPSDQQRVVVKGLAGAQVAAPALGAAQPFDGIADELALLGAALFTFGVAERHASAVASAGVGHRSLLVVVAASSWRGRVTAAGAYVSEDRVAARSFSFTAGISSWRAAGCRNRSPSPGQAQARGAEPVDTASKPG